MKYKNLLHIFMLLLLFSCGDNSDLKLESEIKGIVTRYATYISTLECDVFATKIYTYPHRIISDDIYIYYDCITLVYGFEINSNSIIIVNDNGQKKLQIRIQQGRKISTNRVNIKSLQTHDKMIPNYKIVDGKEVPLDIDKEINDDINNFELTYNKNNLKLAEKNLMNFFEIIAQKYNLQLDFKIE